MSTKPPLSPEEFANMFESLGPAADRLRLVGLDHARRVQAGRMGATQRRLTLTRARRASETATIARLEQDLVTQQRVDGAYERTVTRGEIQVPERKEQNAVIHGLVLAADGAPASGLTVAAVSPKGSVESFTCTDAKGYFRLDLAAQGKADGKLGKTVFLQVSDADQVVLYRGDEAIGLAPGSVTYREIRLAGDRLPPCPIPPEKATMPRVLDLPESEALAVLGRFGLDVAQRLTQTAPKRVGLVISQEPAAGTPVTADTKVTLVIGVAGEGTTVEVPGVVGLGRDEAEAKLADAKLAPGEISQLPGSPVGTVLRQKPAAGTQVAPGTPVDLVIAARPEQEDVLVPDLVGMDAADAGKALDKAGLEAGRMTLRDGEPAGSVLAHDPKAGARVAPGTPVNLVVARRAEGERVDTPSVLGRTLDGASEILAAARLKTGEVTGIRDGTVVEQKPAPGEAVPVGSAVALRLGRGRTPDGGRPGFAGDVARRVAADPGFDRLGISMASLQQALTSANVTDARTAARVVELDNAELQRMFGLQNLNHARSLRRMLRDALAQG